MLKRGDRDGGIFSKTDCVAILQTDLNRIGYLTKVDGVFGVTTERNLKAFQKDNSLLVDGIYGAISERVLLQKVTQSSLLDQLPTPVSNSETPWMDWLERNRGQHEIAGDKANPFIVDLFRYTSLANSALAMSDETAWCAALACAALEKNGYTSPDSAAAKDFDEYGVGTELKYGAILTFRWESGERHVTFYAGLDAFGRLKCLGGNQSDSLKYSSYSKDEVVAIRWPIKKSMNLTTQNS